MQDPTIDSGLLCTGQPSCPYLLPSWSVLLPQFLHAASWYNTQHFSQGARDFRKETSFPCSAWLNSAFSFLMAISTPAHQSQVDMEFVSCPCSHQSPVMAHFLVPCCFSKLLMDSVSRTGISQLISVGLTREPTHG